MTMVNVPVLLLLYGAAVSGFHGVVGVGAWSVGRTFDSPRAEGLGRSLARASVGAFLGYTGIVLVWMVLAGRGGSPDLVVTFGTVLSLSAPLLAFVPPVWAVLRYIGGDDSEGEPPETVPQD